MKHLMLAAAAAFLSTCAAPAMAQSVSGCGTTAIAKADQNSAARLGTKADCFAKVKTLAATAEAVHRARIVAIAPKPTPTPTPAPAAWTDCGAEGASCKLTGEAVVRYGAGDKFTEKTFATADLACTNAVFGDPAPNIRKACSYRLTGNPLAPIATAPAPAPTPAPGPVTPAKPGGFALGMNLTGGAYYGNEPLFANLLIGSNWDPSGTDFNDRAPGQVDALGNPTLKAGQMARRIVTPPVGVLAGQDTLIVCQWDGKGTVQPGGAHLRPVWTANSLSFTRPGERGGGGPLMWITLVAQDASDPARNFDCREDGVPRDQVYNTDWLAFIKPFGVLRFMDLSGVNANDPHPTWATRAKPGGIGDPNAPVGMALEHLIAVSNISGADPWFNVPWNADDGYVRSMAQLVHDGIPASRRHVYVENANEVWNYMFSVTAQAEREGLAQKFSDDRVVAMLFRYAQNSKRVMRIWADVFKDRPGQLVRVSGTQSGNPWVSWMILGEGGLAPDIDALAIAPYFGASLIDNARPGLADFDTLKAQLVPLAQKAVAVDMVEQRKVADDFGKRLIAYEAGQHITGKNVELIAALNRSPEMEAAYRAYIAGWKATVNDALVLYAATGPISEWGAWGHREYAGQPLSETPKRRAYEEFLSAK